MNDDVQSWFEQACIVRTMEVAGDMPRVLFRCKMCAALIEGPHRSSHRYWHLRLAGAK